jgi:hypothetical protein
LNKKQPEQQDKCSARGVEVPYGFLVDTAGIVRYTRDPSRELSSTSILHHHHIPELLTISSLHHI